MRKPPPPGVPSVDRWSLASVAVLPYCNSVGLSSGSGFTIAGTTGQIYLVTNYHVLVGRHPETNQPMHSSGHVPDRVLVCLPRRGQSDNESLMSWAPHVQMLEDDLQQHHWVAHPRYGRAFDVVLLPLKVPPAVGVVAMDPFQAADVGLFPTSAVTVVGFPEGLSGPGLTPIWKTGAIASEPDLLVDGQDFLWIDANTRSGMSGSPVLAKRIESFRTSAGAIGHATGPVVRPVGVYAGRAPESLDMTLGRVWRWRGVIEILADADQRVRDGSIRPLPGTLGHFSEVSMGAVANRRFVISVPNANPVATGVSELLRQVAFADQRFGANLERLKLAARIVAAREAAGTADPIELSAEAGAILAECLISPNGWGYPQGYYQTAADIERLVAELRAT